MSPAETTPVSTPRATCVSVFPRKAAREKDLLFSWHNHRASPGFETSPQLFAADSALLDSDLEDTPFPLFGQSPPPPEGMASEAGPLGIGIRHDSASPRHSNLTSALQDTSGNEIRQSDLAAVGNGMGKKSSIHPESISMFGLTPQYTSGAVPISMNNAGRQQQRRESNAAGSLMGGMSWGGVSMNSWVRDE